MGTALSSLPTHAVSDSPMTIATRLATMLLIPLPLIDLKFTIFILQFSFQILQSFRHGLQLGASGEHRLVDLGVELARCHGEQAGAVGKAYLPNFRLSLWQVSVIRLVQPSKA